MSAAPAPSPWELWPSLSKPRPLDLICLGRAGVDLYAVQKNTPLEAVQQFHKSVGGSPANIATALARLGGKSAVLSVVGDDGLGRSVRQFLAHNGVDTQALHTSRERRLTSLAITEIRPDDCHVIIYRERAADLEFSEAHLDPRFIASSSALLISGTALSVEPSRQACMTAMTMARAAGCLIVLDMDYRPYGWSSTQEAAHWLRWAASQSQLVIGNADEFALLLDGDTPTVKTVSPPGSDDTQTAHTVQVLASSLLGPRTQAVLLKHGARGCELYTQATQEQGPYRMGAYAVQAQKPMGAGDAFAGALWWAIAQGQDWPSCLRHGAAAAALNVARDRCAEAMPRRDELDQWMRDHAPQPFV